MTIEEQLKQEILTKYKSIRAFTNAVGVPYSTLDSVFKRGIQNSGVSTMIKVFDALDLDIESIPSGKLRHASQRITPLVQKETMGRMVSESEYRLVEAYREASEADRAIIDNIVERYSPAEQAAAQPGKGRCLYRRRRTRWGNCARS